MNAPTTREQFLRARQSGLGGSDLSAVMGFNSFRTPVQVYLEKIGETTEDTDSMRLRFGDHNEEFVAREYSAITGRGVRRYKKQLRHRKYPAMLGNVDRLTIEPGQKIAAYRDEIRTDRGLECKTVDAMVYRMSDEWGEPGTDEVPPMYLIQCAAYMGLTGCSRWDLAALIGSGAAPLAIYHLARDRDLEDEIFRRGQEWWDAHVVNRVAPDPVCEADVALLYPQADEKRDAVVADDAVLRHVAKLKRIKQALKHLEALQGDHGTAVRAFMGDAGRLMDPASGDDPKAKPIVTWNNRRAAAKFDLDAFVDHLCPGATPGEHALFIEDVKRTFIYRGEPGRTFIVK